jgi:hypothetical protein
MVGPAGSSKKRNVELLIRVRKLQVIAFQMGFQSILVERAAYRVLETECGRPRAIGRYIRFAIVEFWVYKLIPGITFRRRYYWYRYVRFWSVDRINERLDQEMLRDFEKHYGPNFKADMEKLDKEDGCER